jgi:hypothetical protein
MKRLVTTIVMAAVVSAVALVPATALAAPASVNHTTYKFLVGGVPPPAGGLPDVSMAPDGSTITMLGSGNFNAGPDKSVSGLGTYTITYASGVTVSGWWTATQMLSFVNYGSAAAQGPGFPANWFGGQAQMMVTLSGVGSGVLQVTCTLGTPPPGQAGGPNAVEEGIDLKLGNGLTFNREAINDGDTLFYTGTL